MNYDITDKDSVHEFLRRRQDVNALKSFQFLEAFERATANESFYRFFIYTLDAKLTRDKINKILQSRKEELTEEEIKQVKRSRKQIKDGKSIRFKNAEEYLKSLDSDE